MDGKIFISIPYVSYVYARFCSCVLRASLKVCPNVGLSYVHGCRLLDSLMSRQGNYFYFAGILFHKSQHQKRCCIEFSS